LNITKPKDILWVMRLLGHRNVDDTLLYATATKAKSLGNPITLVKNLLWHEVVVDRRGRI
jgi:hypothetical protein